MNETKFVQLKNQITYLENTGEPKRIISFPYSDGENIGSLEIETDAKKDEKGDYEIAQFVWKRVISKRLILQVELYPFPSEEEMDKFLNRIDRKLFP